MNIRGFVHWLEAIRALSYAVTASVWQPYDSVLPLCIVLVGSSVLGFSADSVLLGGPYPHCSHGDAWFPRNPCGLSVAVECRTRYAQTLARLAVMDAAIQVVLVEAEAADRGDWT